MASPRLGFVLGVAGMACWPAEDFFVLCCIAVKSHSDRQRWLPFWGGGCQPGQPAARVGPTITFSHLPFLEPCSSGAGMDRRSRACMLMVMAICTQYTGYVCVCVVQVGQIVGTRNTAQHQNMQRKNVARAAGTRWTGCLVSSSHRQKDMPCQRGGKRTRMERQAWRLEQA